MTHEINISLPQFEGPLMQLLHQIKKEETDILDIQIAKITELGISLIQEKIFFSKAPDLIYCAALLLVWKTRKLLPKEENSKQFDEEENGLVTQFLEQTQFKQIVSGLLELEQKRLPHFSRDVLFVSEKESPGLEEVQLEELAYLFQKIMEKLTPVEMEIEEEFDLSTRMDILLKEVAIHQEIDFEELFSLQKSKGELIVLFLALLELIKLQKIIILRNASALIIKGLQS